MRDGHDMKEWVVLGIVSILLMATVFNEARKDNERRELVAEISGAVKECTSNNIERSYQLCIRVSRLEQLVDLPPQNCKRIYYPNLL